MAPFFFDSGNTNQPLLDPGATLGRTVHGGNAPGNSFVSVLESAACADVMAVSRPLTTEA